MSETKKELTDLFIVFDDAIDNFPWAVETDDEDIALFAKEEHAEQYVALQSRIKELEAALNDIKETTEHLWFSQANQGDKPLQEHKLIWVPKVMDIANKALKSTQEK